MAAMNTRREANNRTITAAWEPVGEAMAVRDVAATRASVKTYAAYGFPLYDWTRAGLARFYIAQGAIADARLQLDFIVLGEPTKRSGSDKESRNYDPVDYFLWLSVAKDAPVAAGRKLHNSAGRKVQNYAGRIMHNL